MKILVTGTAGFIGFHLAQRLLDDGHSVVGVDSFTPYYDLALKERRNALLSVRNGFQGHRIALEDRTALERLWQDQPCDIVIHLAAQAGVRYSLENPRAYVDSNLVGTFNVMELTRLHRVKHFMLASTSSAYGANVKMPFCETDRADHQLTLYAATKKSHRKHDALLCASLGYSDHGFPVFHRLWALGPPRHGTCEIFEGHSGRDTD